MKKDAHRSYVDCFIKNYPNGAFHCSYYEYDIDYNPSDFNNVLDAFDLMHTQNGTNTNQNTSEAGC